MMMYLQLATLVFLFLGSVSAQNCTLCEDGSEPGEGEIGGLSCSKLDKTLQEGDIPLDSEPCRKMQAEGYINFCCPTYPDVYCSMCEDGSLNITYPKRSIPYIELGQSGNGKLCEKNLLKLPDELDGTCLPIERASYYCGCPNAPEPACNLCETIEDSQNAGTRRIPPYFNTTCNSLATAYTFVSGDEECAELNSTFPVDTETFCECDNASAAPNQCSLCGNASLVDPTMVADMDLGLTCMDILDMAPHVTSDDYCTEIQSAFTFKCCDIDPTEPPTSSPTMSAQPTASSAPSMAPSVSLQPTKEEKETMMPTTMPTTTKPTDGSATSSATTRFSWPFSVLAAAVLASFAVL